MKKAIVCVLILLIPALLLAGCGAEKETATITIAGVSSAEKAAGMLAESYKVRNEINLSIEITDSDQALDSLKSGKADLALIDRKLTDEEKSSGLSETAFASPSGNAKNMIYIVAPQEPTADAAGFRDYIISTDVKDILSSAGLIAAGA